jgi:DNA-binding FadR family transcriptional regulator
MEASVSSIANLVPIRVLKTAEVVADHIRQRIIRGELKEGDTLPPEGQLMVSLSISRPTLREAFRILEAKQLISVTRGSRTGARIHQPKVEIVSRYAGFGLQRRAPQSRTSMPLGSPSSPLSRGC